MKKLGTFNVSDKIENLISENLIVHPEKPMTFMIKNGTGNITHAISKFIELNNYFKKYEVEMINNGQNINGGFGYLDLEVFISDPLCLILENYL